MMERWLDAWEVFPAEYALEVHVAYHQFLAFLKAKPRSVKYDRWGRPFFAPFPFAWSGNFQTYSRMLSEMSRAKAGKSNGQSGSVSSGVLPKTRWVNVGLDDDAQGQCLQLASDPERLASLFLALHGSGVDTSFKRAENGDYMACLFGDGPDGSRLGLSGWGGTPHDAIAGLLIKWFVCLDGTFDGLTVKPEAARFR